MCYTQMLANPIRMTGLKPKAVGRNILSNSPSGKWENVDLPHHSGQNADGFLGFTGNSDLPSP